MVSGSSTHPPLVDTPVFDTPSSLHPRFRDIVRYRLPPERPDASIVAECTCRKCMEPMSVTCPSTKDMLVWTMSGAFKCSLPLLACLAHGCGYERTATSSDVRLLFGFEALNPQSPAVVLTRELLTHLYVLLYPCPLQGLYDVRYHPQHVCFVLQGWRR